MCNICIRSLMDRTEASDAFNAGSIPVGCIYITLIIGREMREAACGFLRLKNFFSEFGKDAICGKKNYIFLETIS